MDMAGSRVVIGTGKPATDPSSFSGQRRIGPEPVILAENPVGDWHFRITSGIFNLNKYNPNQVRQPCSTTGKS